MGKDTKYINGYVREHPTNGIMREKGELVNPLPEIGSRVIVEVYRIKQKNALLLHRSEDGYILHDSYLDIYKRPRVYTVESYTKGKDVPFDKSNAVVLKAKLRDENYITQTIKTTDIASGYMRLTLAPDDTKVMYGE